MELLKNKKSKMINKIPTKFIEIDINIRLLDYFFKKMSLQKTPKNTKSLHFVAFFENCIIIYIGDEK